MPHTEQSIQVALQRELDRRGHQYILPNVMMDWGEADLISVTKAGYLQEWEIKVSKSDFRADFKKGKHRSLCISQHDWLAQDVREPGGRCTPSCFWYAIPDGLVPDTDVPDYAGLAVMAGDVPIIRRRAPMLHRRKIGEYQLNWLLRISAIKLWAVKLNLRQAINKNYALRGMVNATKAA